MTALRKAEWVGRKFIRKKMLASPFRRFVSLLLLFAIAQATQAQTLRAEFSPLANFAYQLDCLSGVRSQGQCAGANDFRALWKREFGIDTATASLISRWATLRREYSSTASNNRDDRIDASSRVLIAAFAARDEADYRSRLELLLPNRLAPEAVDIVQSLYPAFEKWWQREGAASGKPASDAMIAALQTAAIKQHVNELFAFYGSPKAARAPHTAYLLFRPGLADAKNTSGANFGSTSIVEFFAETESRGQTPVIVHEYSHYVFGVAPKPPTLALRSGVVTAGGEIGLPLWGLVDEALASAIGNGRVSRTLLGPDAYEAFAAKPLSFYNIANIDLAGKAMMPHVDAFVASGQTIFDRTFPDVYAKAVRAKLGDVLNQPATFMTEYSLVVDGALGSGPEGGAPWASEFQTRSRMMAVLGCCGDNFSQAIKNAVKGTAVIAVSSSNADKLASVMRLSDDKQTALDAARREAGAVGALLVSRETGSPPLILAIVNDGEALSRAAKLLAATPALKAGVVSVK